MKGGGEFILATDVGSVSLEREYGNEVIRECLSFVGRKTSEQTNKKLSLSDLLKDLY